MKKNKERFQWQFFLTGILIVAFAFGLLFVPIAIAQEEVEEKAKREVELEKIVVTAPGKREEDIQKVPASETYFSDIELEDAGIENTFDLSKFSPNVYIKHNPVENVIIMRGISSFSPSLYTPVGFYVDGVSYPLQFMQNPDFFDIERVEVLRGPQGTLYGRNTESGLINIITKKPGNVFEGKAFGEYGNYNSYRLGANIRGPILKDKLYIGVSGLFKNSDGYIENKFNNDDKAAGVEHKNGRVSLRFTPTERWDISLIGDIMDTDDGYAVWRYISGPMKTDPHEINQDEENQYTRQEGNNQALRIKYKGDSFNLVSVTTRSDYELECFCDMDYWVDPQNRWSMIDMWEDTQYSQEIRVFSPKDSGPFEWLAGAYAFDEKLDTHGAYYAVNVPAWGLIDMSVMHPYVEIDTTGYAAFGQGTYTLFDRLHLTAGLRYDHQDLEGDLSGEYFDFATWSYKSYNDFDCEKDLDYDEWLPKFSVAYDFTDDVMTYVSASKGYITGGYNYYPTPPVTQETFTYDPEYTWNYEAGVKTTWLNNKLRANLALFYIDIKDKQVSVVDQFTTQITISNAAEAHSQGMELELEMRPIRGLDIFAGFGYTEAKFDDFTAIDKKTGVLTDYEDNYLQFVPKYTYNLGVQYRHESGFFGRVDLLGKDKVYGGYANIAEANSYETVNLRLGYEREHLDFILWCKNIFDEEYLTHVSHNSGTGYDMGVYAPPRTFGATLTYRF
jgi:iron complex outermembrane receptor protein